MTTRIIILTLLILTLLPAAGPPRAAGPAVSATGSRAGLPGENQNPAPGVKTAVPPLAPAEKETEKGPLLTLDDAVRATLNNHPLRRAAREKQAAAQAGFQAASADLLPKLKASYSYFHLNDKPYGVFGPVTLPIGDDDIHTWKVTATQPLFTGFALITRKQMAGLDLEGEKLADEQLCLDLVKNTKLAYYRIFLALKHYQVAKQTVANLKAHEHDAEALHRHGMVAYNDLLQARVARAQAETLKEQTVRDLELARARLNLLMNRSLETPFRVKKLTVELDSGATDPAPFYQEALTRRPELRRLKLAIEKAGMAVTLARSGYFPTLALVGSYEQTGHNFGGRDNEYRNHDTAAIGFEADWTFWEWGKTREQIKQQQHNRQALAAKLKAVANRVRLEVKTALRDLRLAAVNARTAESAVVQAEENYRITKLQYQQQLATATTLLDAVTFLSQTRNQYYDSLYGYLSAQAELERALGRKY